MSDRKEFIQHYNTIDGIPLKPWRISDDEDELLSANGEVIDDLSSSFVVVAKHIVKCVNEHDNLVAEVERLKEENEELKFRNQELRKSLKEFDDWQDVEREVEKLKEALKKCDPYRIEIAGEECSECGGVGQEYICNFCKNELSKGHKPDCEYIKLIGGEGE